MIDASNMNIENLQYETKVENGILYYYINGIKIDKYDLLATASNETSTKIALDIIRIADRLYSNELNDYTYSSLRNCVYENIIRNKNSKSELYYQGVFKKHIKEILGDDYEIVKKASDNKNILDAWVSYDNKVIPVEMKIGDFDKKALKQLLRYIDKYNANGGIAIGSKLTTEIPNSIRFISMKDIKSFDE